MIGMSVFFLIEIFYCIKLVWININYFGFLNQSFIVNWLDFNWINFFF